jgi:hypothetical protein
MKRNGFATAYSLIFLLLVTVVGTAILFMSRISRQDVAQYRDSEASARAAAASLRGVEAQFQSSPKVALAIVRKFTSSLPYLLGDSTGAGTEHKLMITGTSMSYSAKILNVDTVNHLLLVEGTGYDGSGGQKKVTGLYFLDGLSGLVKYPSVKYALYMGGGIECINSCLTIIGSVYLGPYSGTTGGKNTTNGGGAVHITGNFKAQSGISLTLGDSLVVSGTAYLQNLSLTNSNKLKAGSTDVTMIGNDSPDSLLNPLPADLISKEVSVIGSYTVATLESMWAANLRYNIDWLVLSMTGDVNISTTAQAFTKKVVWITNGFALSINANSTQGWYDCDDLSNTFIYVNSNGHLSNFGVPDGKRFRGYIYLNTTYSSQNTFSFGKNTTFNGAIGIKRGVTDINAGGPLTINCDEGSIGQAAVQELIDLGLLIPGN